MNKLIYKSNALIRAAYKLSLNEQKVILACISKVEKDKEVTDQEYYKITADEFAEMTGVADRKQAYRDLCRMAKTIKKREVTIYAEPNGEKGFHETNWIQATFVFEKEAARGFQFSNRVVPYLKNLKREFTRYEMKEVMHMDSVYAVRIYEMMMQWQDRGHFEVELKELKKTLMLEECYPSIKDFKLRVLEVASKQINQGTDYSLTVGQRKTGRNVSHITFTFAKKKKKEVKADAPKKVEKPAAPAENSGVTAYVAKIAKDLGMSVPDLASKAEPGETWDQLARRLKGEPA